MHTGLDVKYALFLSYFNETLVFWTDFRKTQISNFMNIRQWEPSCSLRTDGQTDLTKLLITYRSFANALNKETERAFVLQNVPFILSPSTARLTRRKSALAGTFCDSCGARGNDKIVAVYV
jgi:hypothetical protein